MCNFFSALVTRKGKVVWDRDTSSHESLVEKAGLKDDKLEDRDFVRVEMTPNSTPDKNGMFTMKHEDWAFKVDEKGTLPKWYALNEKVFEAATWKECVRAMKPLKPGMNAIQDVVKEIKAIKYLTFSGKVKKEWHVSFGVSLAAARNAAGDAAWDAAWAAAWAAAGDAAGDAAWAAAWAAARDAAWAAARDAAGDAAWAAAGAAAGDAAGDAAWAAARDAARDAAWDAAWDARIYAWICFCVAMKAKLDPKHIKHTEARMDVWRAGYGLRCDVNGRLYCYGVRK